MSSGGLILVVR